ncbi:membrane fusion protein (multidrug efflux system) [Lysobacter niabensis]|uniref:Membrane fusion protein (Multidrug efflux system) n=1 Tax=Agrilutibacter niabensis TaxID=380628 RepID=A0ABU1VM25_9GAMM|nr:HlyD family secretion protein [Lysobacter niabensis]MDR7098531.1 membrane fusion protein (multidrug efflux system) [Lysobacter niabensis]
MTNLSAVGTLPENTEVPNVPKSRKGMLVKALAAAAAIAVGVYGVHWWNVGRFIEDTDDAYVGGDVTVIAPRVSGYIAQVVVHDNQRVRAGDLLFRIDDRELRAALAKAEGAVAAQEALLANLDATTHLQDAVIRQARASIDVAAAEGVRSRDDQARYALLAGQQLVSLESAQRADATYHTALANTEHAQAGLSAAERQIEVIASQKRQAEAALVQAKAERDAARLLVGYTEVRAPVNGVVGNRRARLGAYAAGGGQQLVIVPASGLWVDANFKEGQLARMQEGTPVEIRADILPDKVFHGHVSSLAPATGAQFSVLPPENATGNFTKIVQRVPVRIVLDPKDGTLGLLRPGLSVAVEIDTRGGQGKGAL